MEETIEGMLEVTADHEAGYIVVAGSLGLDLKPKSITIYGTCQLVSQTA